MNDIPEEYYGWWHITETGTWVNDYLDDLGPAMISFTGDVLVHQTEDGEVRLLVVDEHVGVHEQDLGLLWHRTPQPIQDAVRSRIS